MLIKVKSGISRQVHARQSLIVLSSILVVTILEKSIPFARGMPGVLFLLIVSITALLGDYVAGVLAIVASTIALSYVVTQDYLAADLANLAEFLVAGGIIMALAWHERWLREMNGELKVSTQSLEKNVQNLKKKLAAEENKLEKLDEANNKLDELVKEFLSDDHDMQGISGKTPGLAN